MVGMTNERYSGLASSGSKRLGFRPTHDTTHMGEGGGTNSAMGKRRRA